MAKQKNENIKKASDEWEYLTGDEEIKRIEFLKFKWQVDYNSQMENAREEGIKKEKIEIAKNLLKSNIPIDVIINSTGLTEKEVQDLKEELNC